jgi:hypothetical protein
VIAPSANFTLPQGKLLEMLAVEATKPAPKAAACCLVMTIQSIQVVRRLLNFIAS